MLVGVYVSENASRFGVFLQQSIEQCMELRAFLVDSLSFADLVLERVQL